MRPDLEAAYLATLYRVLPPDGGFVMRVGEHSPGLAALLRARGQRQASLLTAWNPGSFALPPFRNRRAQRALLAELTALGYACIPGRNEDPRHRWPVEDSVLVPGLSPALANELAAQCAQVAWLWVGDDATPRLVETSYNSRSSQRDFE